MLQSPNLPISISGTSDQGLTRDQQKFNRLIGQLTQRRNQLMAWEAALSRCDRIYSQRVYPLDEEIAMMRLRLPFVLSQADGMKGLSRSVCKQLDEVICDMIAQTPEARLTPELKALYKQHGGTDFDEDRAEDKAVMKDMMSDLTGFDFNDVADFETPADLLAEAARQFNEQQRAREAEGAHSAGETEGSQRPGRKKSAKQIAREEARAADEKSATQTVREVYRKLASALHPDRETNPEERERKTDLMQRANNAYTQGNLLQLLELQWELEQIDPSALGKLSEQKLKYYLRILKDQLAQLDEELREVELGAMARFQLDERFRLNPGGLARVLEQEAARKAAMMRHMKEELELLKYPAAVKAFVKAYRQQARRAPAEFSF